MAVQACDRFFRVCLIEDATGAFKDSWHDKAVDLLSGPQCAPGHAAKARGPAWSRTGGRISVRFVASASQAAFSIA